MVAFDELVDFWVFFSEGPTKVITVYGFIPTFKRHEHNIRTKAFYRIKKRRFYDVR